MICVASYTGPEAPQMARQMVIELRSAYQMPAFVFNHGAEKRKKEYERVKTIIEQQRKFFQEKGINYDGPLRVKYERYDDQCAVLVGGYADDEAAQRGLKSVRQLKPPDPNRVRLDKKFHAEVDPKTGKVKKGEEIFVNPFQQAFVVRNPTVKQEQHAGWSQQDLVALRKLNSAEDYSLFKCQQKFTLAVRSFPLPGAVQSRSASGKFLETLGLGGKNGENLDAAAVNAHNLAELLRTKANLEAYVLHTRFYSLVTVGGFESPDDPRLQSTQRVLTDQLKIPQAVPMQVPR
jgi:hypothetical protein